MLAGGLQPPDLIHETPRRVVTPQRGQHRDRVERRYAQSPHHGFNNSLAIEIASTPTMTPKSAQTPMSITPAPPGGKKAGSIPPPLNPRHIQLRIQLGFRTKMCCQLPRHSRRIQHAL